MKRSTTATFMEWWKARCRSPKDKRKNVLRQLANFLCKSWNY